MKSTSSLALILLSFSILVMSCGKSDGPTCIAGLNGETELVVYAIHNGDTLIHSHQQPDTVFAAWTDAGDPPNPLFYDKAYVASPGEDHVHIHDLKCGTYRLRLSVFDTTAGMRYTGSATATVPEGATEVLTGVVVN